MGTTLLELRTEILEPIDALEAISDNDDAMYSVDEVNRYINKGIKKAQSLILSIYEDYFLSYSNISIVSGTAAYDLPTDIFANKLRKILYDDGSDEYIVRRIKKLEETMDFESAEDYKFLITNTLTNGVQINIYPTPDFTDATSMKWFYIRDAKVLSLDTDEIDIPEFKDIVVLYARRECLKKRMNAPMLAECKQELNNEITLMIDTLSSMILDEDNSIEIDTSFYDDFDNNGFGGNYGY